MTEPTPTAIVEPNDGRRALAPIVAFGVDVLIVVGFAAIGRMSHGLDGIIGLWTTAWPFLVGLGVGWAVSLAWRAPLAPVRTGIPVWAATVAGGMLLRWASGIAVSTTFVFVASVILLVTLVGWRLVAAWVRRRSR